MVVDESHPRAPSDITGASHDYDEALGFDSIEQGALHAQLMTRMFGDAPDPGGPVHARYRLERLLGSGGMGSVYLAYDTELDRKVALKVLHARFRKEPTDPIEVSELSEVSDPSNRTDPTDPTSADQLRAEARAMARLNHPHVVHVHDVVTHEGSLFVAMELVEGGTLTDWLAAEDRSWREIVGVFAAAARGLHAAHGANVVHRDFKPDNVLMTEQGVPKVSDFGLAQVCEAVRERQGESIGPPGAREAISLGQIRGTPAYMAPEQIRGRSGDPLSDQFSFCVSLYQAVYAERPFPGGSAVSTLTAIVFNQRRPVPRRPVPPRLRRIIERGLSVRPADRFASMAELEAALARCLRSPLRRYGLPLAVVISTAAGGLLARELPRPALDPCVQGRAQIQRSWNDTNRQRLLDHLVDAGGRVGSTNATLAEHALDRWSGTWADAYSGLCSSRHELSVDRYDVRMACLTQQRQQVGALVELWAEADGERIGRLPRALLELPSVERCARVQSLAELVAPDPDVADRVAQLRKELASLQAQRLTDPAAELSARADELRARADAVGYRPLLGEIALLQGNARPNEEGIPWLMEAFTTGLEAGYVELSLDAAILLITREGLADGAPNQEDARERWNTIAQSLSARLGDPPSVELRRLDTYIEALRRHRRIEQATAQLRIAKQRLHEQEAAGVDEALAIPLLEQEAALHLSASRLDEALATLDQIDARYDAWVGPGHPVRAKAMYTRVLVHQSAGRDEDALRLALELEALLSHERGADVYVLRQVQWVIAAIRVTRREYREALPVLRELLGGRLPDSASLDFRGAKVGSALCGALIGLDEEAEAEQVCQRTLAAVERLYEGRPHQLASALRINLATIAKRQGRHDEALALYQRALADYQALEQPDPDSIFSATKGIVVALLALQRAPEAVAPATAALELVAHGPREGLWGAAECLLARVLWDADPGRRDEAVALAKSGIPRLRTGGKRWALTVSACEERLEGWGETSDP